MGQYKVVKRQITLEASGGADTGRVYDAPSSMPIRGLSIILSTGGQPTAAGDLDWEVYYGGTWAGVPFSSVHDGGVSQGNGTIGGGTELAHVVYVDEDLLPPNNAAGPNSMREYGLPIVLELVNDKAEPITINVTFVTEHVLTNVG